MAADEENEDINLADLDTDDGEEKKVSKPPPVPGPKTAAPAPAPAAQDGLKDLQRQIEAERAERGRIAQQNQQLARERDQAIAFAQEAERRGVTTYELYTETQITGVQEQMDALTAQQENAYGDGDFKTVAEINKRLNRLGGQLAILERDKATLAEQREQMGKQPPRQPQRQTQPQAPQPTDPLEKAIQNRTEPTKQFLRKHPELVRGDGSLKRTAIDAHDNALDAGYAVDTPGYFQFIESVIGSGQPASDGAPVPRRAPTTAAPVARGASPGGGGVVNADGTFTVTPKMRRLAEEQGVPVQEWVKNYVRLVSEGRVTPIT